MWCPGPQHLYSFPSWFPLTDGAGECRDSCFRVSVCELLRGWTGRGIPGLQGRRPERRARRARWFSAAGPADCHSPHGVRRALRPRPAAAPGCAPSPRLRGTSACGLLAERRSRGSRSKGCWAWPSSPASGGHCVPGLRRRWDAGPSPVTPTVKGPRVHAGPRNAQGDLPAVGSVTPCAVVPFVGRPRHRRETVGFDGLGATVPFPRPSQPTQTFSLVFPLFKTMFFKHKTHPSLRA